MPSVFKTIFCCLLLLPPAAQAQVWPKESSILNYRLVGFKFPAKSKAMGYILEIAAGYHNDEQHFRQNIIKTEHTTGTKLIAEVPVFGGQYTWRVMAAGEKSGKTFHHFATGSVPEVTEHNSRLRVTTPASAFADAYVLLDGSRVMYDMKGEPVWYLPLIEGKSLVPRDLKSTGFGTVSLLESNVYEISWDGNVLWKGPNTGQISHMNREVYHHEFTRLPGRHYMVYANESLYCQLNPDSTFTIVADDRTSNPRSFLGALVEYDESGNVVWQWNTSRYYPASDLQYFRSTTPAPIVDLHENSFFFDEAEKCIYVSIKYINRIMKIKYPEGTVLATWGTKCKAAYTSLDNGLFSDQHSIRRSADGFLYVFSNNVTRHGKLPEVEKLKMPAYAGDPLIKVWSMACSTSVVAPEGYQSGGNVWSLPDQCLFVSTAGPDNRVFIINDARKVLWSAEAEKWSEGEQKWLPLASYRASIIASRKELEELIFSSMK